MNHCEKYEELCSAYLDGELTAAERAELEAHLAACPDCEGYLDALRHTHAALAYSRIEMPGDLHENIMNLVMAEVQKTVVQTEKPHRRPPVFTMLAAAVAAVLLVLTGAVGELVSTGRDMLGLDDAKTAESAAMPQTAADAGDAAASQVTPFSMPADSAAPKAAADSPAAANQGIAAAPETDGAADSSTGAADSSTGAAGSSTGAADSAAGGTDGSAQAPQQSTESAQQETVQPRLALLPPQDTLPETPASLREQSFAFCYVASGTGDAPSIEATYLDRSADGNASYYAIKNNMSVLEKALADLSKGGFEPKQYDGVSGVILDGKAENGLIIVMGSD